MQDSGPEGVDFPTPEDKDDFNVINIQLPQLRWIAAYAFVAAVKQSALFAEFRTLSPILSIQEQLLC